jgi:hypothetical protein
VALRLGVGEGDHELDAERGGDALEGVKAWGHAAGSRRAMAGLWLRSTTSGCWSEARWSTNALYAWCQRHPT